MQHLLFIQKKIKENHIAKSLLFFSLIFLTFFIQIKSFGDFNPKFEIDDSYKEYIKFHEDKEKEEKDFLKISYFADEIVKQQSEKEIKKELEKEKENYLNSSDNCLTSDYAQKNGNLSNNQKFVLGKCNPVLFIPGFLSTRLVASIDCPNLVKDKNAMEEMRFFCGYTVCQKSFFSGFNKEEYTLWPSLFDNPFKMFIDGSNPDNSCMAYVMRIFKNEEECPKLFVENNQKNSEKNYKPICLYNKYIKVTYSGNTEKTKENLQCGVKPISRILDAGYSIIPDKVVNSGSTAVYYEMSEFLKSKGYKEGFSMAGLPYDFRVLSKKNEEFSQNFIKMVEMLYNNTGKKVVITSHSLGNIFTNDILSNVEFKEKLEKMIERNIAILPPYIGTSKDTELFITGTKEFKVDIFANMKIDISESALKFMGAFNPNFYILFLKPFLENLSNKKKYGKFMEAIMERINLERECRNLINFSEGNSTKKCSDDFIEKNSKKFSEIFPFIPKLNSEVCKKLYKSAEKDIKNSDFYNKKNAKREDIYEYLPSYDPCFLRIFDFLNCPLIKVYKEKDPNFPIEEFEKFCVKEDEEEKEGRKLFKFLLNLF